MLTIWDYTSIDKYVKIDSESHFRANVLYTIENLGVSKQEVCRRAGLTVTYLNDMISKSTGVCLSRALQISFVLGMSLERLTLRPAIYEERFGEQIRIKGNELKRRKQDQRRQKQKLYRQKAREESSTKKEGHRDQQEAVQS